MKDIEARRVRIADEPDILCNMAYLDGYRLGESWAERDTTSVAELYSVANHFRSLLEYEGEDDNEPIKNTYISVTAHLTGHKYIGGVLNRHMFGNYYHANGGFDYSVSKMKEFEQGFLDGVRQYYKHVREVVEERMQLYNQRENQTFRNPRTRLRTSV
jgi:hypothetical protein